MLCNVERGRKLTFLIQTGLRPYHVRVSRGQGAQAQEHKHRSTSTEEQARVGHDLSVEKSRRHVIRSDCPISNGRLKFNITSTNEFASLFCSIYTNYSVLYSPPSHSHRLLITLAAHISVPRYISPTYYLRYPFQVALMALANCSCALLPLEG